jgi:hypothetical protein
MRSVTGRQKQLPPGSPVRQLGGRGVLRSVGRGVAEEARTRGFAAPAFAGCALVVGLASPSYSVGTGAVKPWLYK